MFFYNCSVSICLNVASCKCEINLIEQVSLKESFIWLLSCYKDKNTQSLLVQVVNSVHDCTYCISDR